MNVGHNIIQLGSDPDPDKNFIIRTPPVQDGTLEIRKGTLEAPGALVATFDGNGLVDPREWVNMAGTRTLNQTYVNNTGYPIDINVFATTSANDGYLHLLREKDGVQLQTYTEAALGPGRGFTLEAVILPGWSYIINHARCTLGGWHERRLPEGV